MIVLLNGYAPIPILPGQKRPAVSRWSHGPIDAPRVADWGRLYPDCGIGLRTGHLVGLDSDIADPDIAHAVCSLAVQRFGATLERVGRWPRRMLLYRAQTPFRKMRAGQVEVLGAGQQLVAYGRHPGTGQTYAWLTGDGPAEVPLTDLPILSEVDVQAFLAEAMALQPDHRRRSGSRRSQAPAAIHQPVRDSCGRVFDGRDAWLSSIAYHAVHDALDAGEPPVAAALASVVWGRFRETADLERPRKDGEGSYSLRDAVSKVQDKLRLLGEGRLPARDPDPVAPDYVPPDLSADGARTLLDDTVTGFCAAVLDWHSGTTATRPATAVRATVGLGKSRSARRHLCRLAASLKNLDLPGRLLVFTATHALAEEAAAAWEDLGARTAVLRGYDRTDPSTGHPMCRDREAVTAAHAAGTSAQGSVCTSSDGARCRYFDGCLKQQNRRDVADADVVIAPYDALFTGLAFEHDDIACLVVDEACWPRALEMRPDISVEDFEQEIVADLGSRALGRGPVGAMVDLRAFRCRAAHAFEANGPGPVRRDAVLAAGLTTGDCNAAAALERRRKSDPGLRPDLQGPARALAFQRAHGIARLEILAAIWGELARLAEADEEQSGRLQILPPDDTGRHRLVLRRVKPLHESLRGKPILHLDATFRPRLAGSVLTEVTPVTIEAATPHMHLRLVTGSFGKSMLCPESGLRPDEHRRRQNRLSECVDYVRWQALRHAPGRVLVVTYQAIEENFWGIANVETAHFNAVAGLDVYKDVAALITIGRPLPPSTELEALTGGYFGLIPSGGYDMAKAGVHMTNGATRTVRTIRHSDETAEILRSAICNDELIQAIGRGRGVNRTAEDPLEVHVLADVALPLVHDRVLTWDVAKPDIFQRMLLAGVAVDSPTDAAILHPQLFGSANEAKKHFQKGVFKGQTPMYYTYREMTLKSAAYRRPGRGRGWQRCWWAGDASARDIKMLLEAQLGLLHGWRHQG